MIHHHITYTIQVENSLDRYEKHAALFRKEKLTHAGAQRILRKELGNKDVIVTHIQTATTQKLQSKLQNCGKAIA